eukprot:scaffold1309_cov117-Isochrysis_galbana.AAC.9
MQRSGRLLAARPAWPVAARVVVTAAAVSVRTALRSTRWSLAARAPSAGQTAPSEATVSCRAREKKEPAKAKKNIYS